MAVYVDDLFVTVGKAKPGANHVFGSGRQSCHMSADTTEELHAFAKQLGLKQRWFQADPRLPHYDLTPRKRRYAIFLGAIEKDTAWMLNFERAKRGIQPLDMRANLPYTDEVARTATDDDR